MAVGLLFLVATVSPGLAAATPCSGLYGAEAVTCVWQEDVTTCMENWCHGCGGEQCQLCREDAMKIHLCCEKHWHSTTPPTMCANAEAEEGVKNCVEEQCRGCGGEQCQLCREDAQRISQCCQNYDASVQPEMCKVEVPDVDPCAGLYGAESLTCAWEVDANTCIEKQCQGCSGEQCQLCREDAKRVRQCCQDHWHSTTPPQMCANAFVETCIDEQCQGCGGEQCQLCHEDTAHIQECCSKGDARGAGACSARSILP